MDKLDRIVAELSTLSADIARETVRDVLATLEARFREGPGDDVDAWKAGFQAAIEAVRASHPS